jgi:hypothetical protein
VMHWVSAARGHTLKHCGPIGTRRRDKSSLTLRSSFGRIGASF